MLQCGVSLWEVITEARLIVRTDERVGLPVIDLRRSRTRAAVLRELFAAPHEEVYARGLERITGEAVANVHRELRRLEAAGWVTARRARNRVLYRANTQSRLYAAVSRLVTETVSAGALLREALEAVPGVRLALLLTPPDAVARRRLRVLVVGALSPAEVNDVVGPVGEAVHYHVEVLTLEEHELRRALQEHEARVAGLLETSHELLVGDEAAVKALLPG